MCCVVYFGLHTCFGVSVFDNDIGLSSTSVCCVVYFGLLCCVCAFHHIERFVCGLSIHTQVHKYSLHFLLRIVHIYQYVC